jgi:hypothetical protein
VWEEILVVLYLVVISSFSKRANKQSALFLFFWCIGDFLKQAVMTLFPDYHIVAYSTHAVTAEAIDELLVHVL